MLTRRHALRLAATGLMSLGAFGLPGPVSGSPLGLAQLSSYLQGFAQAEARFEQFNPDGTVSTGHVRIHRPGRMRFDYDAPTDLLVIAASGSVNVFDGRGEPTVYPLRRTSLNILLDRDIDLTRAGGVVGVRDVQGLTVLLMQDVRDPRQGQLHLIFERNPVRLHGWVVVDDMGRSTRVALHGLRAGIAIPSQAFNVETVRSARGLTHQR